MKAKKAQTKQKVTSIDFADQYEEPVGEYARAVDSGNIIAGPMVRLACAKHLRESTKKSHNGCTFQPDIAQRVYRYFAEVLRLNGGDFEGQPFKLRLWQAFILGSLFGWIGEDGYRRFRTAYVEIGKGNGKSPLAGGVGLYCLTADKEQRSEVYAAAAAKDQAMILFRDAVAMMEMSPLLKKRLIPYGGLKPYQLFYQHTNSFFRVISTEDNQSGPRPHCALCDEVHEHPDGNVIDMLRKGFKFRNQPLMIEITNSGVDRTSICFQHHEYSERVLQGRLQDDAWFSYVCGLDAGDKWQSEDVWVKANPNLGVSVTQKYLREEVKRAQGMPAEQSKTRRLNFCEWVGAANPWIDEQKWLACESDEIDLEKYRGSRCWAGLDLSARNDLTALALVFLRPPSPDDPQGAPVGLDAVVFFWAPEEGMKVREDRDRVPYTVWRDQGFIEATPGSSVDYEYVAKKLAYFHEEYGLQYAAFDRWRIEDMKRHFVNAGFNHSDLNMDADDEAIAGASGLVLINHGQGFKDMTPTCEAITNAVVNKTLRVKRNPVLTMCSGNTVVKSGAAEEKKFDKRESRGRIDGIVALAMAVRCAEVFATRTGSKSFWE